MKLHPLLVLTALAIPLSYYAPEGWAAETTSSSTNATRLEDPNSQEVLRAYLQLQEQLHATQLALEQNQKDAREATAKGTEALNNRLDMLEHAIAAQRSRELETMQSSNRVMVIVAGSFAVIGFIAMLLMAYFQWRTVAGLAHLSTALPVPRALGPGPALPALGPGDGSSSSDDTAERSNSQLIAALEQLEKRLLELEHTTETSAKQLGSIGDDAVPRGHTNGNGHGQAKAGATGSDADAKPAAADGTENLGMLLRKGESLLSRDEAQAALGCFDQVLATEPRNADALVKKGTALERLQKLDEALQCYDQAIAANNSMTIAYLHKGGLCNRLERFQEALECYEQALRSQEKRKS